jgi:tetratricopeptide (TPR) repeat protein
LQLLTNQIKMSDLLKDLVTNTDCEGSGVGQNSNPISHVLQNFIESSRTDKFLGETKIDSNNVHLTTVEKQKVKSRSNVMAKQFFPEKDETEISKHMSGMLGSLKIDQTSSDHFSGLKNSSSQNVTNKNYLNSDFEEDLEFDDVNEGQMQEEFMNMALKDPEYLFSKEKNPYVSKSNCYEIGLQLNKQGDLQQAILAFEAEVTQNPKNSSAWRMLGRSHAECDDDSAAISALAQAVKVDPNNLDSILDLACSYTNELNKFKALKLLSSWMAKHPVYGSVMHQDEMEPLNYLKMQDDIIKMFEECSGRWRDDVDIWFALGVLYNITDENEKAVNAFTRALDLRPNDHSLWNKLGATQANGRKSEEAVEAYRRSLKLKPTYVRAWVNLGIAHSNMKQNAESCKYYLKALKMNPNADQVWQYLAMSFYTMKRSDLTEKCSFKDPSLFDNEKF